jgi:hypothetical protein
MKSKNQTGQNTLGLDVANAANEDGISPARESAAPARKQEWSPYEVWRTRVKNHSRPRPVESTPA